MLNNHIDLVTILRQVRDVGYVFVSQMVTEEAIENLQKEMNALPLEFGDHVNYPINKKSTNEVQQSHERYYTKIDDPSTPTASQICRELSDRVKALSEHFPELSTWLTTEIGYQRYRDYRDWISPHRDRVSDQFLSVTITISGSTIINIYNPETDPINYKYLRLVDAYKVKQGSVMMLRAPGFGTGQQVIHEVMPPLNNKRDILNLRMRESVLKPPRDTKWK